MKLLHAKINPGLSMLRGLACLSVFCIHSMHNPAMESGWIGLQIFFVLSGYLITNGFLVMESREIAPKEQIRQFFTKRALRIFPALLIYLLVAVPLTISFGDGSQAGWQFTILMVHNLYAILASTHFTAYFDHLWSLSVEEQFYLLYPWLFIYAARYRSTVLVAALFFAPLVRALLGLVVLWHPQWFSQLLLGMGSGESRSEVIVYGFGFSHVDAFSVGALLALHGQRVFALFSTWRPVLVLSLALVVLAGLITNSVEGMLYRLFLGRAGFAQQVWGYSLINLWACGVIAYFSSVEARTLVGRSLVKLSDISYEFFILHSPVIALITRFLRPQFVLTETLWIVLALIGSVAASLALNALARQITRAINRRFIDGVSVTPPLPVP